LIAPAARKNNERILPAAAAAAALNEVERIMYQTKDYVLGLWATCLGPDYRKMIGSGLVDEFTYFDETYTVGDVVEFFHTGYGGIKLTAEIVSSGRNTLIADNLFGSKPYYQLVVLFKVVGCNHNFFTTGSVFHAYFQSVDNKRMRHAALESLARI
jgi:hypothetical protein